MKLLVVYLLAINLVGLLVMGEDKRRAVRHRWRIPERMLFLTALVGGGVGTTLGMWLFRHKTRHWYFVVGMPLIAILEMAALAALLR